MRQFRDGVPDLSVIRASRGVSLEDIARSTKISLFYLQAIERGEIDKLPGGVYTRSYVRQYAAHAIDFSHEDLLRRFGLAPEENPVACEAPTANARGRLARFVMAMFHLREPRRPLRPTSQP